MGIKKDIMLVSIIGIIAALLLIISLLCIYQFFRPKSTHNSTIKTKIESTFKNQEIPTANPLETFNIPKILSIKLFGYNINNTIITKGNQILFSCYVKNLGDKDDFKLASTLMKPDKTMIDMYDKNILLENNDYDILEWSYIPEEIGTWHIIFGVWDKNKTKPIIDSGWTLRFVVQEEEYIP
jgi:hypothetical protein